MAVRPFLSPVLLALAAAAALLAADDNNSTDFFEKNIRPVLAERCYSCHSASAKTPMGGLLVDSAPTLRQGGASGSPAVVPGKPAESLLLKALRHQPGAPKMPPGKPLTDDEIANFETWIIAGAPDPRTQSTAPVEKPPYNYAEAKKWWSFQPVHDTQPPAAKDAAWNKTAIDRFIFAKLAERGLTPAPLAKKRDLLRRATYDLTGLPPTPDEMDAFLADRSPSAFEKVVDRLLASPAYGERWGRHWLDVVRYADTSGCNSDFPIPAAYRYRNYVIQSFQNDKPYDLFLREQLAGDLLPAKNDEDREEKIIATGYLAEARRFGSRNAEFHLTIEDTIDNVGKGMLGLSVSCARCHDHKFDPIPTKDYYSLYGIFQSTTYAFPGTEIYSHPKDFTPLGTPEEAVTLRAWEKELAGLDDKIEDLTREKPGARTAEEIKKDKDAAHARVYQLTHNPPKVRKAYAVFEGKPVDARIQRKGDPKTLGATAPRGFLTILGGQPVPKDETGSGRRELADWIANAQNPLTARVMVNRLWQGHFGKGIVQSPNDFGIRGNAPTHPELLDYLAARFVESGWSVKTLQKTIMLTRAYQSATDNPRDAVNAAKDPRNDYLWKFDRRRLEAEELRDSMLLASNTLDRTKGEAHPFPAESEWFYSQHKPFVADYDTNRRSVYLMQQRIRKQAFLELWDGADTNATTGRRTSNTTSLQALYLMNDAFVSKQAELLAARLTDYYPAEPARLNSAYQLLYGRPATPDDLRTAAQYLRETETALKDSKVAADQQPRAALASLLHVMLASDEFLFVE